MIDLELIKQLEMTTANYRQLCDRATAAIEAFEVARDNMHNAFLARDTCYEVVQRLRRQVYELLGSNDGPVKDHTEYLGEY